MAFSYPEITHNWQMGGTAAAGAVEYSLLIPMTNGTVTLLPPNIIAVNLDGTGNMSTNQVASNLDPATEPAPPWQSSYRVDIQVTGAQSLDYVITVPPVQTETNGSIVTGALDIVQLSSLTAAQYMVGQSITCAGHIPTGATVVSVNTTTNAATISTAGTAGTALSVVLGETLDLAVLLPTTPQPL